MRRVRRTPGRRAPQRCGTWGSPAGHAAEGTVAPIGGDGRDAQVPAGAGGERPVGASGPEPEGRVVGGRGLWTSSSAGAARRASLAAVLCGATGAGAAELRSS